jgi:outer membrane protein OmpA-like peptidoglycan-associated protein
MRLSKMVWLGLAAWAFVSPRLCPAQTIEERITILEEKIKERAAALPFDVGALVATDYQYNFNTPDTHNVQLHVFDTKGPSFMVNDAALFVGRQRADEDFGFNISFDFGQTSQIVNGVDSPTIPSLREAYLTYKLPWKIPTTNQPITLKGGKFVTLLGYEVIKTPTNFNPNIANSIQFGFGIPFTHTGLLADLPVLDMVTLDLGVVNGWDDITNNNNGATFLGGLGFTPADIFSMYISGTYGPEQATAPNGNNLNTQRGVLSANATLKATDWFTFASDLTWGNENNIPLPAKNFTIGTGYWFGFASYFIFQATKQLQLVLRPEVFNDPEGVRTGGQTTNLFGGNSAPRAQAGAGTVWAITPTIAYQISDNLLARMEYRYDSASRRYFDFGRPGDVRSTQNVLLFEGLFAFSTPPPPPPAAEAPVAQAAPPPAPAPAPVTKKIVLRGVNFDFDKYNIRPDAVPVLEQGCSILKQESNIDVVAKGYTDSIGSEAYNQRLSERRANAVRDWLIKCGISPKRLTAKGFGKADPVASNATAEGRAQNRRTELVVTNQ